MDFTTTTIKLATITGMKIWVTPGEHVFSDSDEDVELANFETASLSIDVIQRPDARIGQRVVARQADVTIALLSNNLDDLCPVLDAIQDEPLCVVFRATTTQFGFGLEHYYRFDSKTGLGAYDNRLSMNYKLEHPDDRARLTMKLTGDVESPTVVWDNY